MKKFFAILAWGFVGAIGFVILFVKSPSVSGQSGGEQASQIIAAGGSSLSKVVTSLEGS